MFTWEEAGLLRQLLLILKWLAIFAVIGGLVLLYLLVYSSDL